MGYGKQSKKNKAKGEEKEKGAKVVKKLPKWKVEQLENRNKPKEKKINSLIAAPPSSASLSNQKGLSALQLKFANKLNGSRFRTINERLYTTTGKEALKEFQTNPNNFEIYHVGFREQASTWPDNPLDAIISWIKSSHPSAVIADMGCGDARLSESIPNKVHSFDLYSPNPRVIACDIAHVPLKKESVDIVVFCLALMGVNITDFIIEALRILKPDGIIRIAEVRSRFDDNGTGIKRFTKFLKKAGFDINPHDDSLLNKMFFELEGVKTGRDSYIDETYKVKPCLYKRR